MEAVKVHKSKLLFKIVTQLNMFTAYYNPAKPDHMLSITFDSHKQLHKFHALLVSATAQSSSAVKQ